MSGDDDNHDGGNGEVTDLGSVESDDSHLVLLLGQDVLVLCGIQGTRESSGIAVLFLL